MTSDSSSGDIWDIRESLREDTTTKSPEWNRMQSARLALKFYDQTLMIWRSGRMRDVSALFKTLDDSYEHWRSYYEDRKVPIDKNDHLYWLRFLLIKAAMAQEMYPHSIARRIAFFHREIGDSTLEQIHEDARRAKEL